MEEFISFNTILIIFIILFPGIIIRRSFYNKKFSKQFYRGQFSERLITTIFWGIINLIFAFILTFLFFKFLYKIPCVSCNLQNIIYFILTIDFTKKGYLLNDFSIINVVLFLFFFIFNIFILPYFIGYSAFKIIRKFKLDLKYSWLTFSNHWHYFFQGEIAYKNEGKMIDKKTLEFRSNENNISILDILTIEGDKKYLYKGILLDYNLIDNGEDLDSLVLIEPMKKNYDKDINEDGRKYFLEFENIPGNFILIPYSNIININVTIKPFSEIINNNSPLEKIEVQEEKISIDNSNDNKENKTEDLPLKDKVMLLILLTIILYVADNSINISYIRYTGGLFFILLYYGFLMIFIQSVIQNYRFKKVIILIILIFIFYAVLVYIFKLNMFNPIFLILNHFNFI